MGLNNSFLSLFALTSKESKAVDELPVLEPDEAGKCHLTSQDRSMDASAI